MWNTFFKTLTKINKTDNKDGVMVAVVFRNSRDPWDLKRLLIARIFLAACDELEACLCMGAAQYLTHSLSTLDSDMNSTPRQSIRFSNTLNSTCQAWPSPSAGLSARQAKTQWTPSNPTHHLKMSMPTGSCGSTVTHRRRRRTDLSRSGALGRRPEAEPAHQTVLLRPQIQSQEHLPTMNVPSLLGHEIQGFSRDRQEPNAEHAQKTSCHR